MPKKPITVQFLAKFGALNVKFPETCLLFKNINGPCKLTTSFVIDGTLIWRFS